MTEPTTTLFISKWAQEIILGLVFVLVFIVKFIGNKMGGTPIVCATKEELAECNKAVGFKLDRLEKKLDGYVKHIHERIDARIDK